MSDFVSIQRLWKEHLRRPFPPGLAGEKVEGECLVMLDANAAGCITAFLRGTRTPGLDATRLRILGECAANLSRIGPQLPDEHRAYFDTLREISERVVRFCRRGSDERHIIT